MKNQFALCAICGHYRGLHNNHRPSKAACHHCDCVGMFGESGAPELVIS